MPRCLSIFFAVVLTSAPFAVSAVSANAIVSSVVTTVPMTQSSFVYDLEKEPDDCIGFLPKPGCGKAPEQPGDRGGALQYVVMAIMLGGLSIIGTVLVRNVIRRDRAIAEQVAKSDN